MQTDTIRLIFTYAIALVVIVGGGILLVIPSQIPADQLLPFMTGIFGVVIGFVFQRETAAGQARATERAIAAGRADPVDPPPAPPAA